MSYKLKIGLSAAMLGVACAACVPTDVGMGETVTYAKAIQTIDPDPVYAADAAQPGSHGEKNAQAVKRYRQGAVKEVERVQTSSTTSGGS